MPAPTDYGYKCGRWSQKFGKNVFKFTRRIQYLIENKYSTGNAAETIFIAGYFIVKIIYNKVLFMKYNCFVNVVYFYGTSTFQRSSSNRLKTS